MGFSRQEYWSGLLFPSPGELPDPGISCIGRWILYHWTTSEVLRLFFFFFWRFLPKNILFSEALFSWHLGKGLSGECNWSINMRDQDTPQALLFCENRRGEGRNLPSRWTQREKHVWCVINELEWHISRNDSESQLLYFLIIKARTFELWCWRTFLKVPWTANRSILKEITPEYSLERTDTEAPILWPPDVKNQLIGKDPDAGNDWRQKEKGMTEDEMVGCHHQHDRWTWVWASSMSWWWTGKPGVLQPMGSQRVGHDWTTELNWNIFIVTSSNSKNKETENKGKKSSILCKLFQFETTLSQPCTKSLEKWEDLRLRISWVLSEHTSSLIMHVALQAP